MLEVLKLGQQKQGRPSSILNSKNSLAILYQAQGKYEQAEPLLLEIIKQFEQKHGVDHPYTLTSKSNLATLYWWMKKLDRSVPLLEQLLPLQEKKLGTDHPSTLQTLAHLGVNYRYAGRLDDAIRCLEVVQARSAKRSGGLPANLAPVPWELAVTYETAKQYAKAEPLYRAIMEQARQRFGPDDLRTASAMVQLGENLLAQQKPTDAEKLLRDTLRIREKAQPDAWTTFNTRSVLGAALLGQDKHAEAEPLLVQGYQGMKKREATIPSDVRTVRLKAALERLVALYDATGKKAEAANYRQELAALPKAAKEPTKK
ncbi:MAG: tetratricopeptide repeat protein [Gemmataceae bacterium]